VCYTGTHDNWPLPLWLRQAPPEQVKQARRYLGLNHREGYAWGLLRGGLYSPARLFIAQMQDYLPAGNGLRTNLPGTAIGNWQWRLLPGEASPALAEKIAALSLRYGRS
jgi:4-alpha-glucanotransferase